MYENAVMAEPCVAVEEKKTVRETLIRVEQTLNETLETATKTLEMVLARAEIKKPVEERPVCDMMSQADSMLDKANWLRTVVVEIADRLGV